MITGSMLFQAVKVMSAAYRENKHFRKATIASILSAMKELKGSHSDEDVAAAIANRLFCDN